MDYGPDEDILEGGTNLRYGDKTGKLSPLFLVGRGDGNDRNERASEIDQFFLKRVVVSNGFEESRSERARRK